MSTRNPIKRSAAIAEFSRDHHFALLLVWKIREGLKNSIEPERVGRYAVHYFDGELLPHFKAEEELLFVKISKDNQLRKQAEEDHKNIYGLIENIRSNQGSNELLQNFADSLEKHVRFEERELYNFLQENIPEAGLTEIASQLKLRQHEAEVLWADPFWQNENRKK